METLADMVSSAEASIPLCEQNHFVINTQRQIVFTIHVCAS